MWFHVPALARREFVPPSRLPADSVEPEPRSPAVQGVRAEVPQHGEIVCHE